MKVVLFSGVISSLGFWVWGWVRSYGLKASSVLVVALVWGLAAMISAVLLGAAVVFWFGVCSQEMETSLMLLSRDLLSNFAILPEEALPSSCVDV
jgi:hypothetical protein